MIFCTTKSLNTKKKKFQGGVGGGGGGRTRVGKARVSEFFTKDPNLNKKS